MKMRMKTFAALAALALPGCALLPAKTPAPAPAPPAPGAISLGELPAQQLERGQCALVLWAHRSPPTRILVTLDKPAVARVQVGAKTVELARVAQRGQPFYGQFPEQRYLGAGISLGVSFAADAAQSLSGGAVISSAVVEYVDAEGWTAIIPAAGLIGCQA